MKPTSFFASLAFGILAFTLPAGAVDLFWNDADGIHRFTTGGPATGQSLYDTFDTRGMTLDVPSGRLYWSDVFPLGSPLPGGAIRSGGIGGGAADNVLTQLTLPSGVAVDSLRGRVYWTDLGNQANPSAVYSSNLDGTDSKLLISGQFLSEIAGIAVDPDRKKLYFTFVNPLIDSLLAGGIARADLDGSNVEQVVSALGKPIGIAVDPAGGGLYWADARSLSPAGGAGLIQSSDLDGQNPRIILGGLDIPYGVALDLAAQDVYWTDFGTGKIQRTDMSSALPFFEDVFTGLDGPTAIAIIPEPGFLSAAVIGPILLLRRRRKSPIA